MIKIAASWVLGNKTINIDSSNELKYSLLKLQSPNQLGWHIKQATANINFSLASFRNYPSTVA